MLKTLKVILPLAIFMVIAFFLWKGLGGTPGRIPSPLIGKPVPTFSMETLKNPAIKFNNKDLLGHVSIINVWATWCYACRAEHPVLMDISEHNKVAIYGLNYKDQRKSALNWIDKYGDPYKTVIFDPKGKLAINFGVYGAPETFVVDKKGIIRYKYTGPISPDAWKDDILPIVKKLQG